MRSHFVVAMAAFLGVAGCGDKNPIAPSAISSGMWNGTISDPLNGAATLSMLFGANLQGTWTARYPNLPELRGTFVGAAREGTADLALTPSTPLPCAGPSPSQLAGNISLNVTVASNRLSGRSTFVSCQEVTEGTVELSR